MEWITELMDKHVYIILFLSLMLELIAIPLPTEIFMSYAGFLAFQGNANFYITVLMAGIGSSLGMTVSYLIGYKLGHPFFNKYGHYIHMGPNRLDKVSSWYKRYGNKLLIVAYFIPGVRHLTGYFSGITRIPYKVYSVFAYVGAFLWVGTFISIGRILGPNWEQFHTYIKKYLLVIVVIIAVFVISIYVYINNKEKIKSFLFTSIENMNKAIRSIWRVKALFISITFIFLTLLILMSGMIEDYLSNEFVMFDQITMIIVNSIFAGTTWAPVMNGLAQLASFPMFAIMVIFTLVWIILKSNDKILEAGFLFLHVLGGVFLQNGLYYIFQQFNVLYHSINLDPFFPSEKIILVVTTYGFAVFLLIRHGNRKATKAVALISFFTVIMIIGISQAALQLLLPSDIVAGYVFGGVWLFFIIILLEFFRLLKEVKASSLG